MANVVIVGAQWGDEGKGKVVDLYTEFADGVVRFGIGPAYEAKMARRGVRMSDLLDEKRFRPLYEHNLEEMGAWLKARGGELPHPDAVVEEYLGYGQKLKRYFADASRLVHDEIKRG